MKANYFQWSTNIQWILLSCIMLWPAGSLRGQSDTNMRLLVAAHANDTLAVYEALAGGADPNATSYDGITALMYAVQHERPELTIILLEAGALPDRHGEGWAPPLYTAVEFGHEQVTGVLVASGADPDGKDPDGRTPLMAAVRYNDFRIAWMLLQAGANPNAADNAGKSPLHHAAASGAYECAALLLDWKSKADGTDLSGNTALMYASAIGDVDLCALLLSNTNNPLLRNQYGIGAPAFAAMYGHLPVVQLLAQKTRTGNSDTLTPRMPGSEQDFRQSWSKAGEIALRSGNTKGYRAIYRYTGVRYPKPILVAWQSGITYQFNFGTHMEGAYVGIKEAHTRLNVQVHYQARLRPDKQRHVLAQQEFQFREYRSAAGLRISKDIPLYRHSKGTLVCQPLLGGHYTWGRYRGADLEAKQGFNIHAGIPFAWQWKYGQLAAAWIYQPVFPGIESSHLIELSAGIIIPTFNHRKYSIL